MVRLGVAFAGIGARARSLWGMIRSRARLPADLWLGLTPFQRKCHLFLVVFVLYLATNPRAAPGLTRVGDVVPTTVLPVSIIRERDFDLDEFLSHPVAREQGWEWAYWSVKIGDHHFSKYPVLSALLVTPLYLVPVLFGLNAQSSTVAYALLGKASAAVVAASSVLLVYVSLRRVASELTALSLGLVYAFASSTWTISSQALWQHGASQLFLAAAIYCLFSTAKGRKNAYLAGLFLGLAVAARPTNAVIAVILSLYLLHRVPRRVPHFVGGAIIPLSLLLWYNHTVFGCPWCTGYTLEPHVGWSTPLHQGLLGILFSPSKGLLVYSPVFIFSFLGIVASWKTEIRDKNTTWLFRYLGFAALGFILLMGKWHAWHGGWSFGPRMLVDAAPIFVSLIVPALQWLKCDRRILAVLAGLAVLSLCVQLAGLSMFDFGWYREVARPRSEQIAFWSIRDSELAYYVGRFGVAGFLGRILGQGLLSATLAVSVSAAPILLMRRRGLLA
jgi:4-amino-4-deoxy-L-arabinose transferase-like glycosyltransferase